MYQFLIIAYHFTLHKYFCLLGDFNARSHNKDNFLDKNDFFVDHFGFDYVVRNFFNVSFFFLPKFNMKLHRNSQDGVFNNEGNSLLETYKSNNLFILNGRCGKDKKDAYTFKNTSIIDYAILSAETLIFSQI